MIWSSGSQKAIWKWRIIIAVNFSILAIGKKKPEKENQGLNGIWTHDLCDRPFALSGHIV